MTGLFPQIEPIPVADADVPYTGKLVWMDISPRLVDNALDATATIRTRPYRILAKRNAVAVGTMARAMVIFVNNPTAADS